MSSLKSTSAIRLVLSLSLLYLPSGSLAASQIQFFNSLDCQQTHVISDYASSSPSSDDGGCHSAPAGTLALYVNDLDDGCTARAYTDAQCLTAPKGLALTPGTCYFRSTSSGSSDPTPVGAFRIVCAATDAENNVPNALVSSSSEGLTGATILAAQPPSQATSTSWDGTTYAEALGRPTSNSTGTSDSTATGSVETTNTKTRAGSVTVDPIVVPTTFITGTGGRHANSSSPATWNTPSLSTRTSTSTVIVTGDVSTYTGDGRSGGGSASSGIRPGQGGSEKSKGSIHVAMLVVSGLLGLSWSVLW